ncbi:helix-turn-helix domain-containing protein [Algoriphagus formosus]|uniref:helix-turn-helix domain-containing protein n=1 Tax=Algoriphagus formosus TaxID=2007308 RepID=UPI000C2910A5|nr:helix-turn-helix domain-containing protein [Algoriphagus formosus]
MSTRTLKRRLAEKELTFRNQVQLIQQKSAQDLLTNSSLSVAEIAFQTGFSEQSAFNRAFKRWTKLSPLEYRKSK